MRLGFGFGFGFGVRGPGATLTASERGALPVIMLWQRSRPSCAATWLGLGLGLGIGLGFGSRPSCAATLPKTSLSHSACVSVPSALKLASLVAWLGLGVGLAG